MEMGLAPDPSPSPGSPLSCECSGSLANALNVAVRTVRVSRSQQCSTGYVYIILRILIFSLDGFPTYIG